MPLLETATKYVLDLLTDNEELNKFPKEFVNESVKWVKSWFLKPEDPKTNAKLEDPNKPIEVKKDIIQDKLDDLKDNPQFIKELTERLTAFEQQRSRMKNVIGEKGEIDTEGSVHLGDKGGSMDDNYDQKNILHGKIKAKGDVRIGDDVISGNQNVTIYNTYTHTGKSAEKTPPQYLDVKSSLKTQLSKGKTAEVIEQLLDLTDNKDKDANDTVYLLSGQLNRLNGQETKGIVTRSEAETARNRLNNALIEVINNLAN